MEAAVAAEGLTVVCRHPVTLTPADVRFLWSEYTEDGHVLMHAFLDRYLCSGPSEVLLLEGPDAFEAARRVKRTIRSRYANGPFANLLHTAEHPAELGRQANHLLGRCPQCAAPFALSDPASSDSLLSDPVPSDPALTAPTPSDPALTAPVPTAPVPTAPVPTAPVPTAPASTAPASTAPVLTAPRPRGRDFRQDHDLPALVDSLWPALQSEDPPAPAPHHLDRSREAAIYLGADRSQSLDSAVTAVWSALPGVTLPHAVMLTLYAGRTGSYPIAVGSHQAVARSHQILLRHGLTACGIGPFPAFR
ncbi:hypothetical protein [Actinoplanes octamycinicus]|uniref:hypothetical protein n=1 Tax=Actinoplanes octamycinicus TaxID=135948 RepID=UPI001941855D|nr:hypothetical protein [Actinoplanes octamycinicus]